MRLNRFLNVLIQLYFLLAAILCLLVCGYSLVTRVVWRRSVANDLFDVIPENLPMLLLGMVAGGAILFYSWRHRRGHAPIYIALGWAFLLSLFCVLSVRGIAVNDGWFLDACINEFMTGDYSSLDGGYLTTYPFQIGYVMFGQFLYILFGPSNFLVYQFLNIGSILLTVWLLYRMSYELWEHEDLADLTAILSMGAVMLYCYATLVYNDIWSLAPQMAAVYLTMRYIRTGSRRCMAGGVAFIAIACVLKTNCYIALIAMVLSLLIAGFREMTGIQNRAMSCLCGGHADHGVTNNVVNTAGRADDKAHSGSNIDAYTGFRALLNKALWAVLAIVFTMCAIKAVNAGYASAAGLDEMPGGVPSTAYFAMGMHQVEDDGCVKYGWYDGSNAGFLAEAGNDSALASDLAVEDMKQCAAAFVETPKYLVKFYLFKFLQQWGDGTCSSMRQMEMTGRNVEPRSRMAESLLYGAAGDILLEIMNIFHTIVYLGVVLYFGSVFRRMWLNRQGGSSVAGVPAIATNEAFLVMFILGGMLFHEIWEASSRYVLRYYLSLLPLAACGYGQLFWWIRNSVTRSIHPAVRR